MRALLLALAVASCGPPPSSGPDRAKQPAAPEPVLKIATTERGPRGGRLVALDERGVRVADLTKTQPQLTLDINPAWSPDGELIAFASNRGRSDPESTGLWIVRAAVGQEPRRLTTGDALERDPRWLPSGRAIIFVSDAAGSLDLYRAALRPAPGGLVQLDGEPERLTRDPGDERSPAVSPDGAGVAFMAIDKKTQDARLRLLDLASGAQRDLTDGPFDATPAFSPDGKVLAFSRPEPEHKRVMEINLLDLASGKIRVLPEPLADVTGPIFTIDGRHLLATATYRSAVNAAPILSSVVVLDLQAKKPVWRALHDPAFVESRIGAALAPRVLLPSQVDQNAPYAEALKQAIERHLIERAETERERRRREKK